MRGTFLVFKKELIEFSKDRKTLFFTIGFPLVLYPLIFSMMSKLGHRDAEQREGKPSRIVLVDQSGAIKPAMDLVPKMFSYSPEPADLAKAMADDELDLRVDVAKDAAATVEQGRPFAITVRYDRTSDGSRLALKRFQEMIDAERLRRVQIRFEALGAKADLGTPFTLEKLDVSDIGRALSKRLGSLLPYVLLITMYAGAMQNGAYMSAGERERGTLMSLLATRLPRRDIILGKQLALFFLSIFTALLNLAGMAFGFAQIGADGREGAIQAGSLGAMADPGILLLTLALLIPLGLFFTALVVFVGIQAKTTREAATELTPGIIVLMLLGVFSMAPGIEKVAALPWVPVLNVSLTIRKLFAQQAVAWEYLVALGMTIAIAAVMTALATRILNRESSLFKA